MRQFIIPYLSFENSLEVAKYYERVFDGEIKYIMRGKDVPGYPEDKFEDIVHLELLIQDHYIYMGDYPVKPTDQAMLLLDYKDLDVMKRHYENMKKDGKVEQEMKDTFWGAIFGTIEDKYGMKWEFHYMKPRE